MEYADKSDGGPWNRILRITAWGGAAALLAAPLVAMRFTREVNWTGFDFAVFAAMLAAPLAVLELTLRATKSWAYRAAVAVALGAAFVMTWANLAVGIVGDEHDPLNLMFFGVLAVGAIGAVIARFQARGMARVMVVMAILQVLAAVVALIGGHLTVLVTAVFLAAWLLSAWLFQKAAKERAAA